MSRWAVIEVPSRLGLSTPGVEDMPTALLDAGLGRRLGARHAGRVVAPPHHPTPDPVTGILNADSIADYATALADMVEDVVRRGEVPLVLGGDCSIILGSLLALRRLGRYGLLFVDGHADFYQPEADPAREAASMDLALATGRGPRRLTDLGAGAPLVRDEDVVVFGYRDSEQQAADGSQPLPPSITPFGLNVVRQWGVEDAAAHAVAHLTRDLDATDGFFVHVDVDVLDDAIMPAVDYRLPGGLGWAELATTLRVALASARVAGLEVTIYNPRLDEDSACGRRLAEVLANVLSGY